MASLTGMEVLLLEDAQDLLSQMRMALESRGAAVLDARTAKSGVLLASQVFPHVIVIDLGLVGEGGFHAMELLRLVPGISRVPVLAIARGSDREGVLLARSMGATEVLLKPFASALFVERVEKLAMIGTFGAHVIEGPTPSGARLTLPVELLRVGEDGFTVEAHAILGQGAEVGLDSPLLRRLGCAGTVMRGAGVPARPTEEGTYLCEIGMAGVAPRVARAIREFLRGREPGGAEA